MVFNVGTTIYDVAGETVGVVSSHGAQAGNLIVDQGAFHADGYIPLTVIDRTDAYGVYLTIAKQEVVNTAD